MTFDALATHFELTDKEWRALLPSGIQDAFTNFSRSVRSTITKELQP
jgi:hypothetical protein